MNLGRVTGRITCTNRVPELGVHRLAIVQPVDEAGAAQGSALVAVDPLVRASAGELVWYVNGYDAVDALEGRQPVDAAIVGMVDR
jgi:ethanolamine utilization protein EutN